MTLLTEKIIQVIKKIPEGKVATYGQIALLAGRESAARQVVWVLHSCSKSHRLPWQRVLNSKGQLSFAVGSANYKRQKSLLQKEGVVFKPGDKILLSEYQWSKKPTKAKKTPRMFS